MTPLRKLLRPVRFLVWLLLAFWLLTAGDMRADEIALAIAPHQFSVASWELGNLPDKWARRIASVPSNLVGGPTEQERQDDLERYFAVGSRLREIDDHLILLEAADSGSTATAGRLAALRRERDDLTAERDSLRPGAEDTLESAIADTLRELGFGTRAGVFPPVDTALTGSPTVLVLSPRNRIERQDGGLLAPGLDNKHRSSIEGQMEAGGNRSALVVNTGGIALYPSITAGDYGIRHTVEIIAHEWVHQWLWFRPLGRRYFDSVDFTVLNETVASIAGHEIGQLALRRLTGPENAGPGGVAETAPDSHDPPAGPVFDFQAEMRTTRIRVDELLEAGAVAGAEAYMEERRRLFVEQGYPIRRLNQAYFAFHGTYATTGAAGVSVVGEQVQELRRRSPSLREFLRTAATIKDPAELAGYVADHAK